MSALTIPVQIKTATASGQTPTSLLAGELGLDPWLGRLWWADNNGNKQFAPLPSIASSALASDVATLRQNMLYENLVLAAKASAPTGMVDGIADPFSSTADINTGASSGYTFNSAAGTIGATPGDAVTKALLHFDGANGSTTFTDAVGHTFTPTGSPTISTAQSVFGAASLRLPGSAYLTAPSSADFAAGTGDFTFEFRLRLDSVSGQQYIFDTRASSGASTGFYAYANGNTFYVCNGQGTIVSGGTITAGTWCAVAFVKYQSNTYIYVNGSQIGSGGDSGTSTSQPLTVGAAVGGGSPMTGYIDEFRYTKGLARYTASYTPATSAFTYNGTPAAMVLQSTTLPINAPISSPSAMEALIQVDSTSAAFTPNTDMLAFLSRDGGTTFTQATLSLVQTLPDGTALYDTGWLDVTGQPAGNSTMTYKITTPTQKAIVLTGVAMQVRP